MAMYSMPWALPRGFGSWRDTMRLGRLEAVVVLTSSNMDFDQFTCLLNSNPSRVSLPGIT